MSARNTKARASEQPSLWLPASAVLVAAALMIAVAHAQTTTPDSTGPQTAVPAPRTNGRADVPGGSSHNGVIRPPSTGGTTPVIHPPVRGSMPVIPPPGTPSNQPNVQPK